MQVQAYKDKASTSVKVITLRTVRLGANTTDINAAVIVSHDPQLIPQVVPPPPTMYPVSA